MKTSDSESMAKYLNVDQEEQPSYIHSRELVHSKPAEWQCINVGLRVISWWFISTATSCDWLASVLQLRYQDFHVFRVVIRRHGFEVSADIHPPRNTRSYMTMFEEKTDSLPVDLSSSTIDVNRKHNVSTARSTIRRADLHLDLRNARSFGLSIARSRLSAMTARPARTCLAISTSLNDRDPLRLASAIQLPLQRICFQFRPSQ